MKEYIDLEVLFYPLVFTTAVVCMIIAHFRKKRKERQKKVMPKTNSPPVPKFDTTAGFDEGVIG